MPALPEDASPIAPVEPTWLEKLESRFSHSWPSLHQSRLDSLARQAQLNTVFHDLKSGDSSLVVFGSVARQEVTGGSDLDWILLIDGQSMPEHKAQEARVAQLLAQHEFIEPGRSGIFGTIVGSHDLIHNIGGEDDSNANTTRRVLLLLESAAVGNSAAWSRVRKQILRRYLEDDRGLLYASADLRLPRFLLNDLTRYWRTITVDFVYKQRSDQDRKWALRNAKLRMSRKLLYATGLMHCFFCQVDPAGGRSSPQPQGAPLRRGPARCLPGTPVVSAASRYHCSGLSAPERENRNRSWHF